ncbi:alpha-N-acetylgalactosaminidase-like isoform X2 [Tubulanus polymorphus]|uniref:alpha-N-acetylgalactosaminidase-like isoform X2 n=1 Tax=Tubulanus polymorphus TaxID=672921 RepID=UPI003DA1DD03
MKIFVLLLVVASAVSVIDGLDNGLARTPPMGWLTWQRFRCVTDCKSFPDTCISEKLIKEQAQKMKSDGYLAAGYQYIIIDDCWLDHTRAPDGSLRPDPVRFPNGIKHLADYVHSLGLKFGIYEDFGTKTCAGYPGSEFYMELDADTFAKWGVDYVKFDGCNSDVSQMDQGVAVMQFFLNKTGRPILFSCENPVYNRDKPDYASISKHCNLWRNYNDIQDSWASVSSIIEFYGQNKYNFSSFAKPGSWNDPDELIIGNFGLSNDQERVQMALWAVMASPLIMSTDLRTIRDSSKDLLLNEHAIAINQDALGIQGNRIQKNGNIEVWTRPILPKGSFAVAIMNTGTGGTPQRVSLRVSSITKTTSGTYSIVDVFENRSRGTLKPSDTFMCDVNPSGVCFVKFNRRSARKLYFKPQIIQP